MAQNWSDAKQNKLIQDNLNKNNSSSSYENFEGQKAFQFAQQFEFHYTLIKGSWLNAIAVEFSTITRGCLKRRIPTKKMLEEQIITYVKERQDKQIKINWKFDITMARRKMNPKYTNG